MVGYMLSSTITHTFVRIDINLFLREVTIQVINVHLSLLWKEAANSPLIKLTRTAKVKKRIDYRSTDSR